MWKLQAGMLRYFSSIETKGEVMQSLKVLKSYRLLKEYDYFLNANTTDDPSQHYFAVWFSHYQFNKL